MVRKRKDGECFDFVVPSVFVFEVGPMVDICSDADFWQAVGEGSRS